MLKLFKKLFRLNAPSKGNLDVGLRVFDGEVTSRHIGIDAERRSMHLAVLGKSGSGKSSLLRHLSQQDIAAERGFVYFDIHGDATPFLLRTIAARERELRRHLSSKLVVIEPADPELSVGFNPLEQESPDFVRTAELAEVLKQRWHLDYFGARTDELLRNSLFVLSANRLTLLELAPFLTRPGFRAHCLKQVPNAEVRQYFELRYDQVSEAMRTTMREPILNKTSAFTADPHFRHIVGQERSTFSIREAMDQGFWVIVNLEKGRLGEQALSLGSLIFTVVKNALFTRQKRSLFTVYCDEIQNLVASGSDIETVLSEARKFGVAIVSANQFLDQYPTEMRAAILAMGTHAFFQLSSVDAAHAAQALDGGKPLTERLKNLPQRHCIVKSGSDRWVEAQVPLVHARHVDYTDLINRSRYERGRVRAHIERDIAKRQAAYGRATDDVLKEWE
jgi:energy-coupling factor transporter ATP-binding protein EcfA2